MGEPSLTRACPPSARTVARSLRLNEDLTEAVALAHDVGHPPFGHAGEAALNDCLRDHGGFDHNLHGLRRLDLNLLPVFAALMREDQGGAAGAVDDT